MKTKFYVCGIGYDENKCVTDYECNFGKFNTYEEAYELFVKLQCEDDATFFTKQNNLYNIQIQLEECEETNNEINYIDVKNEWWITNPNFESSVKRDNLWVCEHCLCAIESREGYLPTLRHYIDDDALPSESRCDWCKDDENDVLYELI